ncbi:MAG: type II 3-dehydroquinate dehydratase [Pseudomonadota bacterium]|nr:type II 3-dehydroquinate dehydratase [Pseudomonadota bacterium]MEC8665543.1 type II 3-dehydroquinate dehydratase [Pseudomonadota bacterium]
MRLLILNGPNLNMLGQREPEIYGHDTLADIKILCEQEAEKYGATIDFRQSNHEGVLVDWIQEALGTADGIIINAAAYTHTSVAIHDALKLLSCPIVEVHLSDPHTREEFRHKSFIEPVAQHIFKGLGKDSYIAAIKALAA